jgi:hypothetical protein
MTGVVRLDVPGLAALPTLRSRATPKVAPVRTASCAALRG